MRALLSGVLAAVLALASSVSAAPLWGGVYNYTPPDVWSGLTWDSTGAGAALDPAYYSGAPAFTDTFNSGATCPEIGTENFGSNPGFKFYAIQNGASTGQLSDAVTWGNDRTDGSGGLWPFDCTGGGLKLSLKWQGALSAPDHLGNTTVGHWVSGQIGTHDYDGDGFTQKYGYFEVQVSLPASPSGTLCPFTSAWSHSRIVTNAAQNGTFSEVDWYESCLDATHSDQLATTQWEWPGTTNSTGQITVARHYSTGAYTLNLFNGALHKHGLLRTPNKECYYYDRTLKYCRRVIGDEMRQPMQIVVDMTLGSSSPTVGDRAFTYIMTIPEVDAWACPAAHPYCE